MQMMTNDTEIISAPDFDKGIDIRYDGIPSGSDLCSSGAKIERLFRRPFHWSSSFDPWYTFGDERYFRV